jgi:hypothetical protein
MILIQNIFRSSKNMFRSSAPRQEITTIGLYLLKAETVAKYVVNDILNCLHL